MGRKTKQEVTAVWPVSSSTGSMRHPQGRMAKLLPATVPVRLQGRSEAFPKLLLFPTEHLFLYLFIISSGLGCIIVLRPSSNIGVINPEKLKDHGSSGHRIRSFQGMADA